MRVFKTSKEIIEELIRLADIKINGDRPWDIQIKNEKFFNRVARYGSLGLGESYMDGWWDCDNLDQFFYKVLKTGLDREVKKSWRVIMMGIRARVFNLQKGKRAFQIGERHYDTGNDLFMNMLDKRMTYTCGYWENAKNLDEAQEAKLDLVCKKLGLKPGQSILDIGCGWGSFIKFATEKYKLKAVGITVSKEQTELGKKLCHGLPVEIRLQNYRNVNVNEKFDHIVSLGMFEHVGVKNYRDYFKVARRCLKEDGLFLLHTIGSTNLENKPDPWTEKYIFPNSIVPNAKNIIEASNGLLVIEDWHNFGADYDPTLMAWFENFAKSWPKLKSNYSERFYRMWKYYLLACAGGFRARISQVWQIVFSKESVPGGYKSVR